jgi:hypothetical protein
MEWVIKNNSVVKSFFLLVCLACLTGIGIFIWLLPSWLRLLAIPFFFIVFELTVTNLKNGSFILVLVLPTIYLYKFTGWSNASIADITILTIFMAWIFSFMKEDTITFVRTKLDIPLLLFLGFSLIAMVPFFFNISASLGNLNDPLNPLYSLRMLLTTFEAVFIFYFIVNTVRSAEEILRIVSYSMISLVIVCAIAIWQYLNSLQLFGNSVLRIGATFGPDANALGMYFVMFIPILFFSFFYSLKLQQKIYLGILLVLSFVSLIVTYSKGSFFALAFSLGFFFLFSIKFILAYFKRNFSVLLVFFAVTCFLFFPVISPNLPLPEKEGALAFAFNMLNDYQFAGASVLRQRMDEYEGSYSGRVHLWNSAMKIWSKYPFFGAGVGRFPAEYTLSNNITQIPFVYDLDFVDGVDGRALKLATNESSVSLKQFFRPDEKNEIHFSYKLTGNTTAKFIVSEVHGPPKFVANLEKTEKWLSYNRSFSADENMPLEFEIAMAGTGAVVLDDVGLPHGKNLGFEQGIRSWYLNKINPNKLDMIQTSALVAHNIYLHILAERGVFAFIAFIWAIFMIFYSKLSLFRETNALIKFLSIALLASVFGLLVHGLVDNTVFFNNRITMLFWLIVGLLFAKT